MKKMEQQLQELEKKQEQLKARILQKRAVIRKKERQADIRRKIILGSWLHEKKDTEWIKQQMLTYLETETDRKLFGI